MLLGAPRSSCFLLLLVLAAACTGRGEQAPCQAVAGRLLVVAQTEASAARIEAKLRERVLMQLPALRDAVEQSCTVGKWAESVRRCMVLAADGAALAACQRDLSEAQRAQLQRASLAAP